jgi:hypothetical protein
MNARQRILHANCSKIERMKLVCVHEHECKWKWGVVLE